MSPQTHARDAELSANDAPPERLDALAIARLDHIADGWLLVEVDGLGLRRAAWLDAAGNEGVALAPGDQLLVSWPRGSDGAVVLGRIGRYTAPEDRERVVIQASELISLQCGDSKVELRADGQVLVQGEDVMLRARGTQRIRAATVAIN